MAGLRLLHPLNRAWPIPVVKEVPVTDTVDDMEQVDATPFMQHTEADTLPPDPLPPTTGTEEHAASVFDIKDPDLLFKLLTAPVHHPETDAILLTSGCILTPTIVFQLRRIGVHTVEAAPCAGNFATKTMDMVSGYMHSIEEIVRVSGQSTNRFQLFSMEMEQVKELQAMMQERMSIVQQYFDDHAVDALHQLDTHHTRTAHHCITTGLHTMAIAKELQWKQEQTFEATMAAITHDIGKLDVSQDTLEWLGGLNDTQWQEIRLHTLAGANLLQQGSLNSATMTALNHHEWYAQVDGQGYGGLTTFREISRNTLNLDIDIYLSHAMPRQLEIVQLVSIADMVSALEEPYAYREAMPPVKVLLTMNRDARRGHFNPAFYTAWHTAYRRKHKKLLYRGLRLPPPCDKEQLVVRDKDLFISQDAVVRHLSYEELLRMDLPRRLKDKNFDMEEMKKQGRISVDLLKHKGIEIDSRRLEQSEINPEKSVKILLPLMETRLNREELLRVGLTEKQLDTCRIGQPPHPANHSLTLAELARLGIQLSKEQLATGGKSFKKTIPYDMLVLEARGETRALFAIVREGDDLEMLEHGNMRGTLGPLRNYLWNKIGLVEMDFSRQVALPDLSHVAQGKQWQVHEP